MAKSTKKKSSAKKPAAQRRPARKEASATGIEKGRKDGESRNARAHQSKKARLSLRRSYSARTIAKEDSIRLHGKQKEKLLQLPRRHGRFDGRRCPGHLAFARRRQRSLRLRNAPGRCRIDAYDRDFALSLLSQEQDALYEIDQALKRIELGTYGVCEMSGKPIPHARLEAIPFARFTVECQSQLEKQNKASRVRQSVTSLFGLTDDEGGEGEGRRSHASAESKE